MTIVGDDTTFAGRARALREQAGLSFIDVEIAMRSYKQELGPHTYSYGTVERIERGEKDEHTCDTVFLAILAELYGCTLEELSPVASERVGAVVRVLTHPRGGGGGDADNPRSVRIRTTVPTRAHLQRERKVA